MATTTCTAFIAQPENVESGCYQGKHAEKLGAVESLYQLVKTAEGHYYSCREEYIEHIERSYDCCYYCATSADGAEHYAFLRENECSHCGNDFVLMEDDHFHYLLSSAVYQSATEVAVQDQESISHEVQPNVVVTPPTAYERSIHSLPPDLKSIFEREYLLPSTITWNTTQLPGTMLLSRTPINDVTSNDLPMQGILQFHGVVRAEIEVQIRINTNPFVCGQLVMFAVPYAYLGSTPNQGYTQSVELYPHSYLNAGYETNARVVLPYVDPFSAAFNLASTIPSLQNSTSVTVSVWNQMRVAETQPTVYYGSMWMRCISIEAGIKMPTSAVRTVYQASEHASALSTIGRAVADSNVPVISQIAKVIGGVTGLFDSPINPVTAMAASTTVDVPKTAVDLRLKADNYVDYDLYEPISLKKYISTYGRVYIDSWSTTDVRGTLLLQMSTTINNVNSTSPDVGGYQVPLLEVSRAYRYWRGTLRFKLHIIATRFHQGQLLVSWTPFGSCTTIDQASATYYTSLDIGKENVFECEIPYIYPAEFMATDEANHGMLQVWVQNALVAPVSVSGTVSVNVYLAAGDDYEFSTPQDAYLARYQSVDTMSMTPNNQASESGMGESSIWRPLPSILPISKRMEGHTDLVHILRRPSRFFNATYTSAIGNRLIMRLPYYGPIERSLAPVGFYMASGSVRWSIVTNLPLNARVMFYAKLWYSEAADHDPEFYTPGGQVDAATDLRSGAFFHHLQSPNERVMRFEMPYYAATPYQKFYGASTIRTPPTLHVYAWAQEAIEFTAVVYWEAGDDFNLYWPLSGPVRSIGPLAGEDEESIADRLKRLDVVPASTAAVYQGRECVQYQGLGDFVLNALNSMSSMLTNIYQTCVDSWKAITGSIALAYGLLDDASSTVKWFTALRNTIAFIANNILPAITAIYTAWKSDGIIQQMALLQLTNMIFSFSSPEKLKEGAKDPAVHQGLTDIPAVNGVVTEGCRTLIRSVWQALGFPISADYDLYISRMVKGVDPASWNYCITVFGHSILYLIHGKSLNVEFERTIQAPFLTVAKDFNQDTTEGLFTGKTLFEMRGNKRNIDFLESYYKAMEEYLELSTDIRIPPTTAVTIAEIRKSYLRAKQIERIVPDQPEPTGVLILGEPGCGKSFMLTALLPTYLIRKKVITPRHNPVFTIPRGDKDTYWNNYNGQEIIAMDDAFQERAGTDPMTLINLINSTRPAIPAADIAQKGMQFEGKVLLCSTNMKNASVIQSINELPALVRRFPICYRVLLNKPNAQGKLDPAVIGQLIAKASSGTAEDVRELDDYLDSVWTFYPHDFLTGLNVVDGSNRTVTVKFSEFVAEISSTIAFRHTVSDQVKLLGKLTYTDALKSTATLQGLDAVGSSVDDIDNFLPITTPVADYTVNPAHKPLYDECVKLANDYSDDLEVETCLPYYADRLHLIFTTNSFFRDECLKEPAFHNFPIPTQGVLAAIHATEKKGPEKPWKGILGILGVAALTGSALYLAFKAFSAFFKCVLLPKLQSYTGDNALGRARVNLGSKTVTKAVGSASYQNDHTYPDTHQVIHKNMVTIEITRLGTEIGQSISALFLDDHTLVCNQHLVDAYFKWSDETTCTVGINRRINGACDFQPIRLEKNYCVNVPVNGERSDLCYVHLRVPVSRVRSIRNFVVRRDDTPFLNLECYIKGGSGTYHNGDDIMGTVTRLTKFLNTQGVFYEVSTDERTQAGDCGRPYILSAYRHNRPLIGLHATLSSKGPGCVPLIYEDIEAVAKRFQGVHLAMEDVELNCTLATSKYWESPTPLYSGATCNGVDLKHHAPTESNLRPLKYNGHLLKHQDWDCPMIPAALKPTGGKHPLITNSQKYDPTAIFAMNGNIHNVVYDHYVSKLPPKRDISVYPIEVAINGNDVMNNLQYNTGCGYWAQFGFKEGKKDFFTELPQEVDPITKELAPSRRVFSDKAKQHIVPLWNKSFVERLEECDSLIRSGTCFATFWISSNKDELRKLEKVRACKTRVFEQPGLEYTLLVRRYFGAFLDFFKTRSGFTFYHGIGSDKEVVWAEYRKEFLRNSDVGHAFDYKNFDGSVNADAFQFFDDFVGAYYKGAPAADHLARRCLSRILRDANHIMGPYFFQSSQGNKSGNPFTDVFNSVCNYYIMSTAYCVARVTKGLQPTMVNFDQDVKMLTYGDDIAMTVKRSALEYFNGPTIAEILSCYGYEITDALKTGVIPNYINFDEITFLKCPFIEHENVTLGPIPKCDIYKELCYAPKSCVGDSGDVQQRVLNVLRFMSHHGENALCEFKSQLKQRGIPGGWLSQSFESFVHDLENKQTGACLY